MIVPCAVIDTARLRLKLLESRDADELFGIRGDAEAMEHWDAPVDADSAMTTHVVSLLLADVAAGRSIYWTARDGINDRFIGLFDLSDIRHRVAELGFMLVRNLWGRGFALEACEALIGEARRLALTQLRARIHVGNSRSERLLLRLGFTESGPPQLMTPSPGVTRLCRVFTRSLDAATPREAPVG